MPCIVGHVIRRDCVVSMSPSITFPRHPTSNLRTNSFTTLPEGIFVDLKALEYL